MSIKYSIITVTYNSGTTVEQTIKSVLAQTYSNFEYILIDGASSDNTVDIIKKYAEADNRIRYISEPDEGIYDAMNKGIEMASGDVIAILNSDDYYESDALEKVRSVIPDGKDFVVYGMVRFVDGDAENSILFRNHNTLPLYMIMHPACFVSKAIYGKYRYDTSYRAAADYDLFLKLYNDKDVTFIPIYELLTNYRMGGMSYSVVSTIETNKIKYNHGLISKRQMMIRNIGARIKMSLLKIK